MKIKRLSADFGVLHGAELRLNGGLNVIEAPNESGKSTWCAFIRAMLYGIDSSERSKGGSKPDKLRYAPWSGRPMRGEMDIEWRGRDITLSRGTRTASAPMREFSAAYTGTGEAVAELSGESAGETLAGVPKAVFERSAFIKQAGVGISGSPELEKRIISLVSSGDEEESYSEADSRLRAWQRARRFNKKGRIPELEAKAERTRDALDGVSAAAGELAELDAELQSTRTELPALRERVAESRKNARRAALERLSAGKNELRFAEDGVKSAEDELDAKKRALSAFPYDRGTSADEARAMAAEDAAKVNGAKTEPPSRARRLVWIITGCAGLLLLALALILSRSPALSGLGGGLALLSAVQLWFLKKSEKRAGEALSLRKGILESYGAEDGSGILSAAEGYARALSEVSEAEAALARARERLDAVSEKQKELDAGVLSDLDFSAGDGEAAELSRRLSEAEARVASLRERRARAEGSLFAAGDPLVLKTELSSLSDSLAETEKQYGALELAVSAMAEANAELQSRFSPRLGQRAGELFSRLTGGRYDAVTVSRDFAAGVREQGDAAQREAVFLSAGAQDQLYLALRLAICELLLSGDEPCPIILDDALDAFDDERMALALELLRELSETRQIILFTCHSREKEYLEKTAERKENGVD